MSFANSPSKLCFLVLSSTNLKFAALVDIAKFIGFRSWWSHHDKTFDYLLLCSFLACTHHSTKVLNNSKSNYYLWILYSLFWLRWIQKDWYAHSKQSIKDTDIYGEIFIWSIDWSLLHRFKSVLMEFSVLNWLHISVIWYTSEFFMDFFSNILKKQCFWLCNNCICDRTTFNDKPWKYFYWFFLSFWFHILLWLSIFLSTKSNSIKL